jgi:DNA-binding NarL/FixJ family response regulator
MVCVPRLSSGQTVLSKPFELRVPAMPEGQQFGQTDVMRSKVETLRCVIVDDNPGFLDAAANFLNHHGITVVGVASTIAEALRCAEQLRPDVTVVDINLGDESGFDLAEHLAGSHGSSPVILTSTHSEQEFADLIDVSPAIGFIPKGQLSPGEIRRLLAAE